MINVVLYKINLKTVCITTVIQCRSQYCDVMRNKLMYFYLVILNVSYNIILNQDKRKNVPRIPHTPKICVLFNYETILRNI
jgi:hypothetical protein